MKATTKSATERRFRSPLIVGLIVVWGLILTGSFLTALLLRFTALEEHTLPIITYIVNGIALLLGGWFSGRMAGNRGWMYGALTGLFFTLLVFLIGFLAFDAQMRIEPLLFAGGACGIGAIGGILGVNTGSNP